VNLLEPVAAGIVGAALLWLVLQPLLTGYVAPSSDLDPLEPEETPRGQALLALKEIEFDRATGKLSEQDFALLNAKYSVAALATLEAPAASAAPDATARPVHCLAHATRPGDDSRYCGVCGAGLMRDDGRCASCGFAVGEDSKFCAGCGVRMS
jgi:hypothetical protein